MTKIRKSHLDRKETTMPVIFSEKKRREISDQIKEAALRLFETKGVRKTTVAELAVFNYKSIIKYFESNNISYAYLEKNKVVVHN